ncbi:MAG: response regulator [Sandaracinaceae bacterium]
MSAARRVLKPVRSDLRLLLVEDNPADVELFLEHVSEVHSPRLHVEHVSRLGDAIRRLEPIDSPGIDAVLLDLGLPDSLGLPAIARLRKVRPEVPLVVLTGNQDDDLGLRALERGAQDFINKNTLDATTIVKSVQFAIARTQLESQVRVILARNLDAMVVVSANADILFVNRAAEALLGRPAEELVGSPFPHDIEARSNHDLTFGEGDEARVAHMRVALIEWGGEPAYLASIRDVTDLRRAQELERRLLHANRLSSIGRLAAGVAHEVNNPASYMLANLAVLKERLENLEPRTDPVLRTELEQLRELTVDTLAGMERIVSVVRSLASFSRIESDAIEQVRLDDVARAAIQMAKNDIRHRATLEENLDEVPPIAGDKAKLVQVVLNLLINAAHAVAGVERDRHVISVTTRHDADFVYVSVADTGIGISEDDRQRLFEPFFTTKPREHGTGLGLSICAEVIEKHSGTIEVVSELGNGAQFIVALPIANGLEPASPSARPPLKLVTASASRVLVIDDEPMLRRALRRLLEPAHRVVDVADASAALRLLETDRSFDMILCDVMMPGMDGPGFHVAMEQRHPELLGRIVYMTGGVFTVSSRDFLSRPGRKVLTKPVTRGQLDAMLVAVKRSL